MKVAGRGRIIIWEGASLWVMDALPGPGSKPNSTAFHSHHAIQATISLGGRFALRTRDSVVSGNAMVAPDVEHLFEAEGRIALVFVAPESRSGSAILAGIGELPLKAIPEGLLADLSGELGASYHQDPADEVTLEDIARRIIDRLAGGVAGTLPDIRVRKMLDYVASHIEGQPSLAAAAKAAGLSSSRARHLFVEQTGLPFRSYVLWQRMQNAVGAMTKGLSLTEAAHEAGFADSAHFSRTFRRVFGIPATALEIR